MMKQAFSSDFHWQSAEIQACHDWVMAWFDNSLFRFLVTLKHGAHATDRLHTFSSPLHRYWRWHTRCPRWSSRRISCQFRDQIRNLYSPFSRSFLSFRLSVVSRFSPG
jgi:hypothetical protein